MDQQTVSAVVTAVSFAFAAYIYKTTANEQLLNAQVDFYKTKERETNLERLASQVEELKE